MIGYVTVGTKDLARAAAYYDALLAPLGAKRFLESDRLIMWSTGRGQPAFGVIIPYDKQPAHCGNGAMTSLLAGSRENVDRQHALALQLGGSDEGAPGERMPGFYLGYFRDLDGNKLNFLHAGP